QLDQKDVITIAPTGAGKTLTFWIPLLFNNNDIVILITTLNGLGDQNIKELQQLGISAVNVTGANATDKTIQGIKSRKYQVIIVSPELIINDRCFDDLWRARDFTAHLFNITIDEGHCISQWGKDFHPEYGPLGRLRWLLPSHVPFHVVSATLPAHILKDISASLNMRHENTSVIRLSNDRWNIQIAVVKMLHSANSFHDINHMLHLPQGIHPPKFMIFCNSRQDLQRMAEYLHNQLRPELQHKILRGGELWGMCCMDAAGMGLDIRDVELVVQWGYIHSLCTLMQRLGRAARDPSIEASGIYFVEKDYKKRKGNGTKGNRKRKARVQQGKAHEQPSHRSDHESSDSSSESDGDEINDTLASCRNTGVSTSTSPGKLLPLSTGLGIDEFELAVMEVFIEAVNQTICRRRIADEYFGNNLIDYALQSDLKSWRQKMLVDLGINDPFFSPALILPDPILTCIINLSHHSKLSDVSSLRDLTDWCYADKYGGNVLDLVCKHYPPLAVVQAPQPNIFINMSNVASLPVALNPLDPSAHSASVHNNASEKPHKATVCSKCKQVGHNGMSAVLFCNLPNQKLISIDSKEPSLPNARSSF
ncbi:P-loop containing nucleoside triphosphate hydrolase protein, partial [Suillus ampliporus]